MTAFIRFLLKLYQKMNVSPPRCRFYPTCSNYADEAFKRHGFFLGGFLSVKRILKCNQFFHGGYDPVP